MQGKAVFIGVSAGIAAYKAADLVSQLKKKGAEVTVVMTPSAQYFVSPLTMETISGKPVYSELFEPTPGEGVVHIELAKKADLWLLAPATADLIARLAHGLADSLLTAILLATQAPILIAPSMNADMWNHPVVQENLKKLRQLGYGVIEPEEGLLACGDVGKGRLPAIETLVQRVEEHFNSKADFSGLSMLVTAGGTREAIDPVRFIGNRSSGKMGYAIAKAARERGAAVTLITGPTALNPPPGVEVVPVESSMEMYDAVISRKADVVIKAAAVADFRPVEQVNQKIKKNDKGRLILELEPTPDILAELGMRKEPGQILVGFAAETENLIPNARNKMAKKKLDMVVANDVTRVGAGFEVDTNIVSLVMEDGKVRELPMLSKEAVAHHILDAVQELLAVRRHKE